MKKIIETNSELQDKLSEIRSASLKAQRDKSYYYNRFYVVASLVKYIPKLERADYGYDRTENAQDNPLYNGLDTVVVATIESSCDYSCTSNPTKKLRFERARYDIRCFYADGLYLFYERSYEKARCLVSLAHTDLCQNYMTNEAYALKRPNKIGTITAKKLQAWTDYVKAVVRLCEEYRAKIDTEIAAFREKLRTICPDKADLDDGSVTINGLTFMWHIHNRRYIQARCMVQNEYSHGIDNFIHLINMGR